MTPVVILPDKKKAPLLGLRGTSCHRNVYGWKADIDNVNVHAQVLDVQHLPAAGPLL